MSAGFDAADRAQMGIITLGDLVTTGARAVGANLPAFIGGTFLVMSPSFALSIAYQEYMQALSAEVLNDPGRFGEPSALLSFMTSILGGVSVILVVQVVLGYLAQAVVMFATVEFMAGRHASFGRSLGKGLGRFFILAALALLNTLAIVVGAFACIIPAFMIMTVIFVSVPAAMVEDTGPIESIQRSAELTRGHRLTIFAVYFLIFAVNLSVNCVYNQAAGLSTTIDPGVDTLGQVLPSLPVRILGYVIEVVVGVGAAVFQAVIAAVFYARVRGIKDGVDANAIAEVFS